MKARVTLVLVLLLSFSLVGAVTFDEARENFLQLQEEYNDLVEVGIESDRLNNTLQEINQSIQAQRALQVLNETPNFDPIQREINDARQLIDVVVVANDEIGSADIYFETLSDNNYSSAKSHLDSAKEQFSLERYELVEENIESFYTEVSRIESESAAGNLLDDTRETFRNILYRYGFNSLVFVLIVGSLLYLFRKSLSRTYFNRKIDRLKMENDVVRDLIRENQDQYFNENTISQTTYTTRNKQYKDLMRENNRKVYNFEERKENL